MTIGPQVLIFGSSRHSWAGLSCAELGKNAVKNINLIVKLDCVDSKPLVEIFTCGQLYCQLHVATAEGHACNLFQTITTGALLNLLLLLERFRAVDS